MASPLGVSRSSPSPLAQSPCQDEVDEAGDVHFLTYAKMLTSPPRCKQKDRPAAVGSKRLRPLGLAGPAGRHQTVVDGARSMDAFHQTSTSSVPSTAVPASRGGFAKKGPNVSNISAFSTIGEGEGVDDDGGGCPAKVELSRLRKRLHVHACELQETRAHVELTRRELRQAQEAHDELRLKHANLERVERTKSSELLEERRKNDDLSKRVTKMSQSLMGVCSSMETGGENQQSSGLQKECFRLVQKNTELTVKAGLLRRQKGWAMAKADILEDEVTSVYLGTHESMQDTGTLDAPLEEEPINSARAENVFKMMLPVNYQHAGVVMDFLTNLTQTQGKDIESFLQSSRILNESVRSECLTGVAREFSALFRVNRQLPLLLRAVERVIKAENYMAAFGGFAAEIVALLGCSSAKMWLVDDFRKCMWTCLRCNSENPQTITLPLPTSVCPEDLAGKGLVASAFASHKPVNVADARADPRFSDAADTGHDGHAQSVLCVPIHEIGAGGDKVRVVLQAIDKLQEPHFDANDAGVLRLLGRVSLEVLQVCEAGAAQLSNAKRQEDLLHVLGEAAPCHEPAELLHTLEHSLHKLFNSVHVALHLIVGREMPMELQSTALVSAAGVPAGSSRARKVSRNSRVSKIQYDGLRGIVGQTARSKNQVSFSASQLADSQHVAAVDLPVREKQVLHTIPICDNLGCVAVCQFVCAERGRSLLADDKVFHPENASHFRLLIILLDFVHKHLRVFAKADTKRSRESGIGVGAEAAEDDRGDGALSDLAADESGDDGDLT